MAIAGAANGVPQLERETPLAHAARATSATVAWTATPIVDQWGTPRVLISGADVTERKRQEAEIRASRSRIVAATDAARRRLERNLHDGAQQRLAALSLSLRLAESKLETDVDQAAEILVSARAELAEALDELRELARGLHPNVLTDRGLGPALEALVAALADPGRVTTSRASGSSRRSRLRRTTSRPRRWPTSAKYAHATFAEVRVAEDEEEGRSSSRSSDDGVGGADPARGSGIEGLEDRVEALDGTFEVESPPGGGTRVRATIPTAPRVLPL